MKRTVLVVIVFLFALKGFSQMSVSYYSVGSKLGVAYNFNPKLWAELRLYSNADISEITPQLVGCYNFVQKERFNVYVGIGGMLNTENGVIIPVGIQFTPFEKFNHFLLHIELDPTISDYGTYYNTSWGLRYRF
jgi:hypothetical protein